MSKNRLLIFRCKYLFFNTFTNYGLLLVQKWSRLVSTNSELGRNYKSVLIDPETLHEKEISNQVDFRLDVAAYMERLALLDGSNMVTERMVLCIISDVITGMDELKPFSCFYWLQ